MKNILPLLLTLLVTAHLLSAVTVSVDPNSWIGQKNGNETGTITYKNNTNKQLQIDGVRACFKNANVSSLSGQGSYDETKSFVLNDTTFDFQVGNGNGGTPNSNLPNNIKNPGFSHTIKVFTTSVDSGKEWTPYNIQTIIVGGKSLAEKKVNKDISGITLDELAKIMKKPEFYDSTLFVLDTLGIHGSKWGAGFIDTWYDQEKDEPIWQIQVGEIPPLDTINGVADTFRYWGSAVAFAPDSMDVRDSRYKNGKPLYMMGAAMAQEYMNIDMQYLLATGFQESNAGLYQYKIGGGPDTTYDTVVVHDGEDYPNGQTVNGWSPSGKHSGADTTIIYVKVNPWVSKLVPDKVNYYNLKENGAMTRGPMHFVESSYHSYVYEGYPKFFPYNQDKDPGSPFFIEASANSCPLNAPTISNAYFLSSLYMWYTWQLVVAKLGEDALDFFKDAQNREISAQMVSWAWNKGFNGSFKTFVDNKNRDGSKAIDKDVGYVGLVWNGVNHLEYANRNSVVNGGDRRLYDGKISKKNIEEFFFGEGGTTTTLGKGGLLHHFDLSDEQRNQLWSDLDSAFTMLKGQAPSTKGTDFISFRYDYLAVLRIAKRYLDLSLPVPKGEEFKNWTTDIEKESHPIDRIPPFLHQEDKGEGKVNNGIFNKTFTVYDTANMVDSAGIRSVEWTMDSNWGSWIDAKLVSGTIGKGKRDKVTFDIQADKYLINRAVDDAKANGTALGDTIIAWVKVTDVNNNELIDTFKVWANYDPIKKEDPTIDSANIYDNNRDGNGDSIEFKISLSNDVGSYTTSDLKNIQFEWPKGTVINSGEMSVKDDSTIVITNFGELQPYGVGKISAELPDGSKLSGEINDKVGPVIVSAYLREKKNGGDSDTLTVTFSEEITGDFRLQGEFLAINGKPVTSFEALSGATNRSFVFVLSSQTIHVGDSLNINSSSKLFDLAHNSADINNPKVKVKLQQAPIGVKESGCAYYDRNGDGALDFITLQFNKNVNKERLEGFVFTFNWKKRDGSSTENSVTSDRFTIDRSDSSLVDIVLDDAYAYGLTSINDDRAKLIQPNSVTGGFDTTSVKMNDKIAPVVVDAQYKGMRVKSESQDVLDTLIVTFSEPIENIDTFNPSPFKFANRDGKRYSINIIKGNRDTEYRFIVRVIEKSILPTIGDSIWINEDAHIRDNLGNIQNNYKNRGTVFSKCRYNADYSVIIYPNPVVIGNNDKNELVEQYSDNGNDLYGVFAIAVAPYGNRPTDGLTAKVSIFDVVGNAIVEDKEFEHQKRSGVLLLTLKPKNREGRNIGRGTYLAIITVTDSEGKSTIIRRMVGVQKK